MIKHIFIWFAWFSIFGGITYSFAEDAYPAKKFREFEIVHFIYNGKAIDESTKLQPKDEALLSEIRNIGWMQRNTGGQSFERTLQILKETDLSLVAEKALIYLVYFRGLTWANIRELHFLAYCDSVSVKTRLPRTLAWFRLPESIHTILVLICDPKDEVSQCATRMLCYFGIEALTALPFIRPNKIVGFDALFLAKTLRHICFLVFTAAGQGVLPSNKSARVLPGYYLDAFKGGVIYLQNIEDLVFSR